jgi:Tfp pilus assembly protein PilV
MIKKGISLVEVVVGVSLIAISLIGLVGAYNFYFRIALKDTTFIQASFLLEEGLEAARSIRDNDWDSIANLISGNDYGFEYEGNSWQSTTTLSSIDGFFYRTFVVSNILRDSNDDISLSGTEDPNTKEITVTVSWFDNNSTTTKSISTYLTKLF